MSALTRPNLSRRRDERRERVEAKHYPEAVFMPTEEQALTSDLAVNELKATPAWRTSSDHFALEQQNRGGAL